MRKIIVLSMITLDGVMQSPGGPGEDTSGGFKYGGWVAPYADEVYGKAVEKELKPADYLLGRKTVKIWEYYWPAHADFWPGINDGTIARAFYPDWFRLLSHLIISQFVP
jgi:hypothetical protein